MANVEVYRQIYNVLGMFVSPSPSTGYMFSSGTSALPYSGVNLLQTLPRVQSCAINYTVPRENVNQYGQLARLDYLIVSPVTVSMTLDYLPLDGYAEALMGFAASGQQTFISGMLDGTNADKNYFLGVAQEGTDLAYDASTNNINVVALGNGFVSNYSLNLAVNQIPRAAVTIEASNIQTFTGSTGNASPAINFFTALPVVGPAFSLPQLIAYTGANVLSALRPGDIQIQFPRQGSILDYMSGIGTMHVQSVALSVPIALDNILELGNPFPISRKPRFPIDCTLSIDALQGDINTGNISNLLCNDAPINLAFSLNNPNCSRTGAPAITVYFNQAKLVSRDYSSSIGQNSSVRLTFQNQIGGLSSSYLTQGIVFSGTYGEPFA
jgi:hypothetical protein